MKTKWYSNPYQDEVWEAKKQKDKIDNEIAYALSKICAFFLALGVVYFLLK
jgi:hypothetical protein